MNKLLLTFLLLMFSKDSFSQITIYVADKKADCSGVAQMKCMQIKFSPEDEWQNFYGTIDGFDYEEGYEYEIVVDKIDFSDPPADASSVKYFLSEVKEAKIPLVTLLVANRYTECEDTKIFKCLLVKEKSENEWKPLHQGIKEFAYKEGYEYEIEAEKKLVSIPEDQGYLYEYTLKNIISERPTMVISKKDEKVLDGNHFTIRRMRVDSKMKGFNNKEFNMKFDLLQNSFAGKDGCNSAGCRVEINNSSIKFSNCIMTRMFCEDVKEDKIFHPLLNRVDNFKVSGKYLKLYEGKKLLIEMKPFQN